MRNGEGSRLPVDVLPQELRGYRLTAWVTAAGLPAELVTVAWNSNATRRLPGPETILGPTDHPTAREPPERSFCILQNFPSRPEVCLG